MKNLLAGLFLPLILSACADRPIVYVGTQMGAHVQGIKDGYPSKVSVGYDRNEVAWLPDADKAPMLGGFDGEISGLGGIAVSEILATGNAASGEKSSQREFRETSGTTKSQPFTNTLIVSTTSKFNLGIEAASSDGASPSFNAGFKRSVLAQFPARQKEQTDSNRYNIPSIYADISVHASGLREKILEPKGIPNPKRRLSAKNGVRVVQTIATGRAAELVCEREGKPMIDGVIAEIGKKD